MVSRPHGNADRMGSQQLMPRPHTRHRTTRWPCLPPPSHLVPHWVCCHPRPLWSARQGSTPPASPLHVYRIAGQTPWGSGCGTAFTWVSLTSASPCSLLYARDNVMLPPLAAHDQRLTGLLYTGQDYWRSGALIFLRFSFLVLGTESRALAT